MMKTICISIFLMSMALLLSNCKRSGTDNGLAKFNNLKTLRSGTKIYVIPGSGCTGCISEIEKLALDNKGSDSFFYIFTRLHSLKLFRNRFGSSFLERHNVIIDTGNIFQYENNKNDIYPVAYKIVNGKFILDRYLKP